MGRAGGAVSGLRAELRRIAPELRQNCARIAPELRAPHLGLVAAAVRLHVGEREIEGALDGLGAVPHREVSESDVADGAAVELAAGGGGVDRPAVAMRRERRERQPRVDERPFLGREVGMPLDARGGVLG